MCYIPKLLMIFRLLLGPVIIYLAYKIEETNKLYIVILMYLGILSDILDGIIARKLGVATEKLRRMDSLIDLIFWISIGISSWIISPKIIENHWILILVLILLEGLCYIISFIRFKKETSTHAYSSKLWGITLLLAFTSIIGFNYGGFFFYLTVIVGLISYIDILLILFLLPKWEHDVPSFFHAYLLRKNIPFKRHSWFH